MAVDELTQFLQAAADAGELLRVTEETDPCLELAAVAERVGRETAGAGPVLLFEHVRGHDMPVAVNLLNHRERFLRLLGAENLEDVVDRLAGVFNPLSAGRSWTDALKTAPAAVDRARFAPRTVRRGLCQQVVKLGRDLSLEMLPIPHSRPEESNRTITAGVTVLQGLDGRTVLTNDVAEALDAETLLEHWDEQSPARRVFNEYRAAHRQMPLAISLGGDPLLSYVASLPLPESFDPWYFSGMLRNENVNLIRARSVELNVPAEAEIVIEGYIDPVPPTGRGRAANRLGCVVERGELPLCRVTAITHRANPIFPATVLSADYDEAAMGTELTERLLLRILRLLVPAVHDLHFPIWGSSRQSLFVSLRGDDSAAVQQAVHSLGGLPFASLAKLIVAVDQAVDLRREGAVWREVCRHCDFGRDARVTQGVPDPCDPTQRHGSPGHKLVIDATRKTRRPDYTSGSSHAAPPPADVIAPFAGTQDQPGYFGR